MKTKQTDPEQVSGRQAERHRGTRKADRQRKNTERFAGRETDGYLGRNAGDKQIMKPTGIQAGRKRDTQTGT